MSISNDVTENTNCKKTVRFLPRNLFQSIELCLEIMVVTMRSRNFFSRKSTYICRLVMTSPKIQIAKKLSDFDRATSSIGRIMLRNNGGSNTKPQFFFTKIDLHMSISDDVTENTNCKKTVRF